MWVFLDRVLFNFWKVISSVWSEKNFADEAQQISFVHVSVPYILGVEEWERKRLTSVSYGANVVGLDSEDHVSSATTP